jgi:sulfatase maturation enzyme AslB (radical SAM superfamily)
MLTLLNRLRYEAVQYRKGLPSVAAIGITERCNLHCRMCRFWIDGNHDAESELTTGQICRMIDELVDDLGVRRIRLIGGEPFVREDTVQIIRHAKTRGIHVNVVTDGFEISEELADQIVESGLDTIRFSLDGVGKIHDKVRGRPGCYRKTADAIRYIQKARKRRNVSHPEVHIFSAITSINYDQVLPLWNESRTTFAPSRYLFGLVLEVTPEMVEKSLWNGKQLLDDHYIPIGKSLRLSDEQQIVFDSQVRQISGKQKSDVPKRVLAWVIHRFFNTTTCPETNSVHFDRMGCVLFCSIYTNYSYGKYPETPVRHIWFSRKHAEFMRKINTGDSLSTCDDICGQTTRFYVGNPRQLARNLLLRMTRSPLKSGNTRLFQIETPDYEITPRREVIKKVSACGRST